MEPTLMNVNPTTIVFEDVTAITTSVTMFMDAPVLSVVVYIDGSEKSLPFDPEFPPTVEYLIAPSVLIGEGVVCRVSPLVNTRETRFNFVSPVRLIHKKKVIVIVDPEVK